jgi:hypothetical protein
MDFDVPGLYDFYAVLVEEPSCSIELLPPRFGNRQELLGTVSGHPFNSVSDAARVCLVSFCETGTMPEGCDSLSVNSADGTGLSSVSIRVGAPLVRLLPAGNPRLS